MGVLLIQTGARASELEYGNCVRLHVVAADDTFEQQALKLKVRDAVLCCARELLQNCSDADAAWEIVGENLTALEAAAKGCIVAAGARSDIQCEAGVFAFPERRYGDVVLPEGDYRALRVVIGEGRGHNWWCVLFPSLCWPDGAPEPGEAHFHSVILDWIRGLIGGGA